MLSNDWILDQQNSTKPTKPIKLNKTEAFLVYETYAMLFNDWILVQQNSTKPTKPTKLNKTEVL